MPLKCSSLPVLTWHSVCDAPYTLCFPVALFEEHCRVLAEKGWFGVGLEQAEDFFLHGRELPPQSFLITLDDGYLDNYVYAWPILRKYGHKAIIFPVAERVTAASSARGAAGPRPTLEDVWAGRLRVEDLPPAGMEMADRNNPLVCNDWFFTWDEARLMAASGVIGFGGHSLRHGAVFTGPEYTDFLRPSGRKIPFDLKVENMPWGLPDFRRGAELACRAFLPSAALLRAVAGLVPQEEEEAGEFFRSREGELKELVASFQGRMGEYETEEERRKRVLSILQSNRNILNQELGMEARSFCWPWGHHGAFGLDMARAAGFEVFYHVSPGPNPPGRPGLIRRLNAKRDTNRTLNRLRIYSRPLWGEIYRRIRR